MNISFSIIVNIFYPLNDLTSSLEFVDYKTQNGYHILNMYSNFFKHTHLHDVCSWSRSRPHTTSLHVSE